jgi:hypothetical protein
MKRGPSNIRSPIYVVLSINDFVRTDPLFEVLLLLDWQWQEAIRIFVRLWSKDAKKNYKMNHCLLSNAFLWSPDIKPAASNQGASFNYGLLFLVILLQSCNPTIKLSRISLDLLIQSFTAKLWLNPDLKTYKLIISTIFFLLPAFWSSSFTN